MLSNCVRYHLCIYVQKYENQIVLGAVFILEEKCVPLKKWFITKSTFYVSTMGWNLFWRNILYKLCYQKIAEKLFGSKKGRNILGNRIGIKKKYAFIICFNPLCHVTRAPNNLFLFHAIYHLSTNTFIKKTCNKVVCVLYIDT